MAATTERLLHLRHDLYYYPVLLLRRYSSHHHFSSSSDPPPPIAPQPEIDSENRSSISSYHKNVKDSLQKETPPPNPIAPQPEIHSENRSSFSSYFKDLKDNLQTPLRNGPQLQHGPYSFSNRTVPQSLPSKLNSFEEIQKNLSEFRRRSAAPPPSSSDISFEEIYEKVAASNVDDPNYALINPRAGPEAGRRVSLETISQSLHRMKTSSTSQMSHRDSRGKTGDQMSLKGFRESLKLQHEETNATSLNIGGRDGFPISVLGKGKMRFFDKINHADFAAMKTEFVMSNNYQDLGKKLGALRPPKKKGKWFSLQELSDRLARVRIEDKEREARMPRGDIYNDVRKGLVSITTKEETKKTRAVHGLDILSHLGGTPDYMLFPPKEHLTRKYFHPDHMSSAEKLKLELKKVRDEFKMSESDCGSARVQVAQLTTKIKHLSNVLLKKDKHSRKGLQEMVQRRKKLLKYLRRTDWDSYTLVLSKLGLRDNPESKSLMR